MARTVRDRLSADTWRVLTTLDDELDALPAGLPRDVARPGQERRRDGAEAARLDRTVLALAALSGLAMESMTRGQAWRFLDMGRRLERATTLVLLLSRTLVEPSEAPLLEAILEVADSGMTYRRRYLANLQVAPVLDLLLIDETNPRSVIFQLRALVEHLAALPNPTPSAAPAPPSSASPSPPWPSCSSPTPTRSRSPMRPRAAPRAGGAARAAGRAAPGPVRFALLELPQPRRRLPQPGRPAGPAARRDERAGRRSGGAVKLRVVHRTGYAYSEPVSTSHHEAHLAPRDGEGRRTLVHDVAITPSPSLRRERFDYFGNRALHFSLREPHRALEVVTTSVVDLIPLPAPVAGRQPRLGDACAIG